MKTYHFLLSCLLLLLVPLCAVAQTGAYVPPKIIVLPFISQGEDYASAMESDGSTRIVLTKIREAIDAEGYSTADLSTTLRTLPTRLSGATAPSAQKQAVLEASDVNIYVEAEIHCNLSSSGNSVKVTMTAVDASTGISLANKVCDSGKFYSNNVAALAVKALGKRMTPNSTVTQDFLYAMQVKYDEVVANGHSIVLEVSIPEDSELRTDSVLTGGRTLREEIGRWVAANVFEGRFHLQGTTEKTMVFDDVRIPVRDPLTARNYTTAKYAVPLREFLESLGLPFELEANGDAIYVRFQ